MKQLLVENIGTIQLSPTLIQEAIDVNGKMIVKGVIQRADVPNQNGRVYPKALLEREESKYIPKMKERRAFGELDHPDSNTINLKNVSHILIETWWEGNDLCGKSEILDTPSGRILKELLKAGCTVGISSRGMGSVKSVHESEDGNDYVEVMDDFELLCWDFVSDPSTHSAYMFPVQESKANIKQIATKERNKVDELMSSILCDLTGTCCFSK